MAQVAITVPDPVVPRVRAALRGRFPEYESLSDVELFRKVVAEHVREQVRIYEAGQVWLQASNDVSTAQLDADDATSGIG